MEEYYAALKKISKSQSFGKYTYIKLSENENAELYLYYVLQLYKIGIHIGKSRNTKEKCSLPLNNAGTGALTPHPSPHR